MTAAAMPMPVDVVAREQPVNGLFEVGLGAAASLDQCDARGCVRNKDVTQTVAAVATEPTDQASDIGDRTGSGTQLHDIGIHSSIMATAGDDLPIAISGSRYSIRKAVITPSRIGAHETGASF
jgi:hypothetical protein